jgi:hypothetical protein
MQPAVQRPRQAEAPLLRTASIMAGLDEILSLFLFDFTID